MPRLERLIAEHTEWLADRLPSEALRVAERDFSEAPIAKWAAEHSAALAVLRRQRRPYNNRDAAARRKRWR